MDFFLSFVLGRFLDSRQCPRQILGFSWQSWLKTMTRSGGSRTRKLGDSSFLESVRKDFLLGFVLGRFLDSRLCPRQVLRFSQQNWLKTYPRTTKTKAKKSRRKHAKSNPGSSEKSSKNYRKSRPDPTKIEAKKLLNGLPKRSRIQNQQRGAT